jgi:hypothetical protein
MNNPMHGCPLLKKFFDRLNQLDHTSEIDEAEEVFLTVPDKHKNILTVQQIRKYIIQLQNRPNRRPSTNEP